MKPSLRIIRKFIFAVLLFLIAIAGSFSQSDSTYQYFLEAGGFASVVGSHMKVNAIHGPDGTLIDLENDLDFPTNPFIFRLDGLIKLGRRSSFLMTGLVINREVEKVLDKDIQVGDSLYHVGTNISAKFSTVYIALSYRYSIFIKEKWNAGASIGMRDLFVETGFAPILDRNANTDNLAKHIPTPVLGLFLDYDITPKLNARATAELLHLNISDVVASVIDSRIEAQYYFFKNFSIGAAYSYNLYKVDNLTVAKIFKADIDYQFYGLTFFLGSRF